MSSKHKNNNMKECNNNVCITCEEELTDLEVELEFQECSSCLDNRYVEEYDISKDDSLRDIIWS